MPSVQSKAPKSFGVADCPAGAKPCATAPCPGLNLGLCPSAKQTLQFVFSSRFLNVVCILPRPSCRICMRVLPHGFLPSWDFGWINKQPTVGKERLPQLRSASLTSLCLFLCVLCTQAPQGNPDCCCFCFLQPETDFFGRPIPRQQSVPVPGRWQRDGVAPCTTPYAGVGEPYLAGGAVWREWVQQHEGAMRKVFVSVSPCPAEAQPSDCDAIESQMGKAVGRSDVWFRFNEGVSNAVRRNLYIRDLL